MFSLSHEHCLPSDTTQGALLSQATISALSLPQLQEVSWYARMLFTMSLMTSLLAVYFTCVQQRVLTSVRSPLEVRIWLTNGIRYEDADGRTVFQSSAAAHQLLQLPYELIGVSITLFIAAFGTYLGSAFTLGTAINADGTGNSAVLAAFLAVVLASCSAFGVVVGNKDVEKAKREEVKQALAERCGDSKSKANKIGLPLP